MGWLWVPPSGGGGLCIPLSRVPAPGRQGSWPRGASLGPQLMGGKRQERSVSLRPELPPPHDGPTRLLTPSRGASTRALGLGAPQGGGPTGRQVVCPACSRVPPPLLCVHRVSRDVLRQD